MGNGIVGTVALVVGSVALAILFVLYFRQRRVNRGYAQSIAALSADLEMAWSVISAIEGTINYNVAPKD